MRALTVRPGRPGGGSLVDEWPEPDPAEGDVLVRTLAVGVCGTDREILAGEHGQTPPGEDALVLGHEVLGEVDYAPAASGLAPGDRVVGIVRRPDPAPCLNCAAGEPDMCRTGEYTERGIKGLHGFAREQFRARAEELVRVPDGLGSRAVLVEPASVVAKAWEHIERIGSRAAWQPETLLVTGAGPIGLLAALLGAQRGLDVHVLDRVVTGPKPDLVARLGARYHTGEVSELGLRPDVVVECTGAAPVVAGVLRGNAPNAVVCLTGVSAAGRSTSVDIGAINRERVLDNDVVFGSVNANRRHYEQAVEALAAADGGWLDGLLTRRVPLERFADALDAGDDDVKSVLEL